MSENTSGNRAFDPAVAAALALWVVVGAGLTYGIWQTVAKVLNLF